MRRAFLFKIFFVFNNKNREGRVVRPVEKITFHNVILRAGKRFYKFQNGVPFGITVVPSVINAKGKKTARLKNFKRFLNCGNGSFGPCENVVASARKPAEIEHNAVGTVRFCKFIDFAVAGAENFAHFGKSVLGKICFGGFNGLRLNIHRKNVSVFTAKLAKINGIVTVSGSCVNAEITGFNMHFKNFVNYSKSAVFAEHFWPPKIKL